DLHRALDVRHRLGAGERIGGVDIHGAGPAHALAAGAAEGQGRVDVVLDPNERVENHRPAIVAVDVIGIHTRVFAVVRIPAVDAILADVIGAAGIRPGLAGGDLGVFR